MSSAPHEFGPPKSGSFIFMDDNQSLLPHFKQKSSEYDHLGSPKQPSNTLGASKTSQSGWASIMSWKTEILSWIGSLCFFTAIVVVLRVLDGRPLPDIIFGIAPNAIIGLLATLGEVLLLVPVSAAIRRIKWLQALQKKPMEDFRNIDQASRGTWGGALLLVHRRGGLTGSLGALVTIIALGISTSVQATLKYRTVYPYTDESSMPIAQYMNGSGSASLGAIGNTIYGITFAGDSISGVDHELLPAPYAMFSPPHTNFTATAHCSTGNCTWESYESLGICNTCQNLTSTLKMTKVSKVLKSGPQTVEYDTDSYTLDNGFGLIGDRLYGGDDSFLMSMLNISTTATSSKFDGVAFSRNGSRLLSVFAVGAAPGRMPAQPDFKSRWPPLTGPIFAPPVAFECMLQLCVRNMRATFINGTLFENEISNWTDESQPSAPSSKSIILRPPNSSTRFVVDGDALRGTASWLSSVLIRNVTVQTSLRLQSPYETFPTVIDYTSNIIHQLFTAMNNSVTGFPDLMDNLANSLSLNLRTISYQPPGVKGKAFSSTRHAVVTWWWLALPLFELITSLTLLVAVIVETRRRGLVPWTNNILASLLHGLDERPAGMHIESQDDMKNEARGCLMELQKRKHGSRLVVSKE